MSLAAKGMKYQIIKLVKIFLRIIKQIVIFILLSLSFHFCICSNSTTQIGTQSGPLLYNRSTCVTTWTIHTETIVRDHTVSFQLNKTTTDTTMDGRNIKMVVNALSPNQWEETQTNLKDNKTTILIRTFLYDKMSIEMRVGAVNSSSTFMRRINKSHQIL